MLFQPPPNDVHQGVPLRGGDLPGAAPGRLPGHEPRHELLHHVRPAARPRLRRVNLTHTHPHKQVRECWPHLKYLSL